MKEKTEKWFLFEGQKHEIITAVCCLSVFVFLFLHLQHVQHTEIWLK